jgi:FAD/FMN-containing dehydrogenase
MQGGPGFGVVTSFTIRAIPNLPTTVYQAGLISNGDATSDANWDAVTYIHKQWPSKLSKIGASGYMIGTPYLTSPSDYIELEIVLPNTTSTDRLESVLEPMFSQVATLTNDAIQIVGSYQQYALYGDFVDDKGEMGDDSDSFPGTGQTKLITSWLYDENALQSPGLKQALMGSIDNETLMYQDFTSGPGVHNPPFIRGGGNAVNPAWRSAIVRPAAEKNFPGLDRALLAQSKKDFLRFGQSLKQLAPNMGAYGNEANADTPDYISAFYGTNYPRLLQIKRTIDPNGTFWCRTCVGSEAWAEGADGSLCLLI